MCYLSKQATRQILTGGWHGRLLPLEGGGRIIIIRAVFFRLKIFHMDQIKVLLIIDLTRIVKKKRVEWYCAINKTVNSGSSNCWKLRVL